MLSFFFILTLVTNVNDTEVFEVLVEECCSDSYAVMEIGHWLVLYNF